MFSFLNPRRKLRASVFAPADLHGLWLPGLDGCVAHKSDALDLIGSLHGAGFRQLFATPPIGSDFPANQPQSIREAYELILPDIRKRWPDLHTAYAASYEMDGRFSSLLQRMDFLTLPGQRLLLRFSPDKEPLDLSDILFRLRIKGYRMLLVQPEIIPYYIAAPSRLKRLREKEVGFVIGLSSLAGLHGQDVQGSAEKLLLDGMAEWTCSGIRTVSETDLIHEIELPAKLAKRLQASPCRSF